jgi:hypothetical protein
LGGKPGGRRAVRRPWHRWVANVRMDLGEMVWGGTD